MKSFISTLSRSAKNKKQLQNREIQRGAEVF